MAHLALRLAGTGCLLACHVLCSRVTSIKLLASVDEHRVVCTVSHQVGIADMVLDNAASQDDHASLLGKCRLVVDGLDVYIAASVQRLYGTDKRVSQ
jgi:hypothetical protein